MMNAVETLAKGDESSSCKTRKRVVSSIWTSRTEQEQIICIVFRRAPRRDTESSTQGPEHADAVATQTI